MVPAESRPGNPLQIGAASLVLACSAAFAAPVGGPHTDSQGRPAVLVGQTRDGIRDYVLGSGLPLPWGLTMYVAPTLDSGGFTLIDGRRSEAAGWYAEGFGPAGPWVHHRDTGTAGLDVNPGLRAL